ncbi:NAD(P)/FAD-dependent oxidoreductase [Paenibacillus sp. 7523-1]|uniref:NAD(P)/FAD-dependent oxidoreductase n=1 Tax=Paenibacillus sp. 7523-1 TaxID=2022550 RepID=UPI000BA6353A|nr:NAD(P)/FAD-dependent oxidoreductase [Paenibacillus sp. 7523-1]PAD28705.1 ferredoxin--NADP(+) reductase [Paenibacillus sp. 7523-1]
MKEWTDLLIIGGGPVGLFGCFYSGMRNASVKIIDSMPQLGGQLSALYPEKYIYDIAGFPKVTAQELINRLTEQTKQFPNEVILNQQVLNIVKLDEQWFKVITDKGQHYCKSVILAAGAGAFQPKRLDLPNSDQYENTNLHYSVLEMERFKDKNILISGGGDSAVDWALMLEGVAKSITLVHRRDKFRAHEHSVKQLYNSSVQVQTPWEIYSLEGNERINDVRLKHVNTSEIKQLSVDEVIINYGFISSLGPIQKWGLDIEKNSILVNSNMETSLPGVYAAGDIARYKGKVKLITVGFGEVATAVNNAMTYIDPLAKLSPGHSSHMKLLK